MTKQFFPFRALMWVLAGLILGMGFYLFFVVLFNKGLADYDLWGYLSFGRVFWEEGFFPYQDVFAYTPTKPLWVYHEWLTGVIFFGLQKYFGPASLQFLKYVLAVFTICLVYATAIKRGGRQGFALATLVFVLILISFGYVPVRAQIFTFFFFALTIYILESVRNSGKASLLRWLPVMMVVWCNVHGGFVSGLGVIFLYGLGGLLAREKTAVSYFLWGVLSLSVTLINPYGFDYWIYTVHAVFLERADITEWYSAIKALKSGVYVFPVSLFLVAGFFGLAILIFLKKKNITEILVVCVVTYLGFVHVRHNVFFGLVLGAYLPLWLTEIFGAMEQRGLRLAAHVFPVFFAGLLVAVYLYCYPVRQIHVIPTFRFFVSSDAYPIKALAWLKSNQIRGNLLCHFDWGEYILWCCHRDFRVAIDGRYETAYREDVCQEYFAFSSGRRGWDVFLKKYPHDAVLLKANTAAHRLMNRAKDWEAVYSDQISVIFVRKKVENKL